jgi:Domain of unknown function (DUF222)
MTTGPATPDPGRDDDPAGHAGEPDQAGEVPEGWRELPPSREDWLTEDQWVAWLAEIEPGEWAGPGEDGEDDEPDPGSPAQPGNVQRRSRGTAKETGTAKGARLRTGVARRSAGRRRGPGQPGSARRAPGASPGPAGAFATGHTLDLAPGGAALHGLAENAAGPGDRFPGATDDELTGILCALDRVEAAACALKHAAVAELIRRRPAPDAEPALADEGSWEEFTGTELSCALADTRWAADLMLDLAHTLAAKLPGTYAAFRAGMLRESKVAIIARAVANLTPEEARQAEAKVLDRAGKLTPGGLRTAIATAVIEVAPDKAKKQRTDAERNARVERWPEPSGNAGLAGRELPPADVLAADQRISWWARQLKKAGLDGDMDQLRAVAYMDIFLGRDSRRLAPAAGGENRQDSGPDDPGSGPDGPGSGPDGPGSGPDDPGSGPDDPGHGGSGPQDPPSPGLPPTAGVLPAGFTGHITLTVVTRCSYAQLHEYHISGQAAGQRADGTRAGGIPRGCCSAVAA